MKYITTNKIKPDDIFVIQFDMSDENFYMGDVCKFAEKYYEELPETSAIILLPNYMTINPMDKEISVELGDIVIKNVIYSFNNRTFYYMYDTLPLPIRDV